MLGRVKGYAFRRAARLVDTVTASRARLFVVDEFHKMPEEMHLTRLLAALEVDFVLDVGANRGQYASMLRRLGYRGTIVSVEPIPRNAARMRELAKGDARWFVEEMALSDAPGRTRFNVMAVDEFSSLRSPDHTQTANFEAMNVVSESIEVRVDTVAALLARYRARGTVRRPFLKLDTQGHDLDVVRGAGERIADFVGLQSELSIVRIYEGAPDYAEAVAAYQALGFRLSALVPNNAGHFPDLIEIDCIMYRPDGLVGAAGRA